MNIKEAFDHLKSLTPEQRDNTTACSVYYSPSDNKFVVIELLKRADEEDFDDPEESDEYFYCADYEAGRIGSYEGEQDFYGGMTIQELVKEHDSKQYNEVSLKDLNFQIFNDLEGISGKVTEYILFQLLPELKEFDGDGEMAVMTNPDGFKKEAIRLVKEKFAF